MQAARTAAASAPFRQDTFAVTEPCLHRPSAFFGQPIRLTASTIALLFVVSGSLWVLLTSLVLDALQPEQVPHLTLHLLAGMLFVSVAALLLYQLVQRYMLDISCTRELVERVFEASPSGIAVIRQSDNRILLANCRFEQLSGYPMDRIKGSTTGELGLWEHTDEQLALVRRLRTEDTVHGFEATFRRADGTRFPGMLTARQFSFNGAPFTIAFVDDTSRQQEITRQVEELTRFDPVTGLPNHRLMEERLQQLLAIAGREEQGMAVLFLALGRCPAALNATRHDGCDELLRCVSVRLRGALRETDTLAVLQKGEFGILLSKADSERELLPVVHKLLDSILEPLSIAEAEFQLHAHIGIAIFPGDGRTPEVLQHHARLALQHAQGHEGENYFHFYAEELNRAAGEQMQIEASILRGIKAGEFFVCYQPIFDRTGRTLVAMEALARWQHSTLGLVGPDKFIPVAEHSGTIVALGDRILELALQNCKYWRDNGHPCLTVSVNVSVRQLKDRQFVDRVARHLHLYDLPPEALCCELTESLLMEHANDTTEQIYRLKELGVLLSIDDFGTGYSSLTYLKHLPVDTLKIDRSFVRDLDSNPDDRAIVTAIVAMARSLHLKVVAEGIETEAQHLLLQELGCDYLQGYHFGKPMDRAAFEAFLMSDVRHQVLEPPLQSVVIDGDASASSLAVDKERSLHLVADVTLQIEPLRPGDRLNTALERFQTDKGLQVLPVVDQQRVAGVLNRSEFIEEQVVGRIGYAFHINHSKKVRDLMQPVPLVIDAEASIEEAAEILHGSFGTIRLENICVTRRGIYQGVLDVRTLVEAITALNLKLARGANPLTGLPGNESIQREINRRLESGMPFDIAYIDIDHFKPYNDFYGFERGDMVIQEVGDILQLQLEGKLPGSGRNFCGHIGGDDFIIITAAGQAAALSRDLIAQFEIRLPVLHGSGDFAKGCYTSFNRQGKLETFSLLSLSVAVINTAGLRVHSYAQLASLASEVKKTAKSVKGSSVVVKDSEAPPKAAV